jgi:hypothetical protein
MRIKSFYLVLSAVLFPSLTLLAQATQVGVEAGFQATDNSGNEDVYRTQVNEDEGLLLRSLTLTHINLNSEHRLVDRFTLEASGFGAVPHGHLALKADGGTTYRLALDYRRFEQFSALPTFANPVPERAADPGQHTYDRTRQVLDLEFVLFPNRKFQPMFGYRWNDYSGPGRTTYHLGEDEFRLDEHLDETEHEFRLGLKYEGEKIQARIEQGWRRFKGTETRALSADAGDGNVLRPYLGEDLTLDQFNGSSHTDADTPVTSGNLRAEPIENIDILVNFVHADAEADVEEDEAFSGLLAAYRVSRFFNGGSESIRSHTESPSWNGRLRVEAQLPADLEVSLGYAVRSRKLDGNALAMTLFRDSITFGGGDPGDYQRFIDARSHLDKDDDTIELRLTSHSLANFRFWAEAAQVHSKTELDEDLAEIVINSGQEGTFERDIDRYQLGAAYARSGHRFSLEWRRDEADHAVVRTDFLDREVWAVRARTHLGEKWLLSGRARWQDEDNPSAGINSEADTFDMGVDLDLTPREGLNFRLAYGIFDFDSRVDYRRPNFTDATSTHSEDGENLEAGCRWTWSKIDFNGDYARYESTGAIDFDLERWSLGAGFPIADKLRGIVEARTIEYTEQNTPAADYETKIYRFLISWRP